MVENLTDYLGEVCVFTFSVRVNTLASGNLRVNTQTKFNSNLEKKILEVVVQILSRLTKGNVQVLF